MTRFELVFRRKGHKDLSEYRLNDNDGEPELGGRAIVDGETQVIRGVEWRLRRDDAGDNVARFICTLVAAPAGS
jgi:hypothetical protein